MTIRNVDIRITAATDAGFAIWESGEIVVALTSRAEVAEWIERRLGKVPGELERESDDIAATIEAMPNVIRPRTNPGRSLWGRK